MASTKTEEFVKYITQQFVTYLDTPREVRREARNRHKSIRGPWYEHWFGQIPMAVSLWWSSRPRRKKKEHPRP
jgi:hypothetical protein